MLSNLLPLCYRTKNQQSTLYLGSVLKEERLMKPQGTTGKHQWGKPQEIHFT
jgi:hypothetical protein